MFFDAIGKLAIGQASSGITFVLPGQAGSYAYTGNAGVFRIAETGVARSYIVSGFPATFNFGLLSGSFIWTGNVAAFIVALSGGAGSYIVTGNAALLDRSSVNWLAGTLPGSAWVTSGPPSSAWTPAGLPSNVWTVNPAQLIPPSEEH